MRAAAAVSGSVELSPPTQLECAIRSGGIKREFQCEPAKACCGARLTACSPMEVPQNVVHATLGATLADMSASTDSCTAISVEPCERTPLLASVPSSARTSICSTAQLSSSPETVAAAPSLYIKECFNWRTIGLLLMFLSGLVLATYLLWEETTFLPPNGYKLKLIGHDTWSGLRLHGQSQLEAAQVVNVFVTHTATEECDNNEECASLLYGLQRNQLEELPFNFLLAGDCFAYEARGWRYASSYAELPQGSSLVLAFVGDFSRWLPSRCQLELAQALLWESQRRFKLQPGYQLYALRNVSRSEWDADALHRQLQLWPLYAGQRQVK